MKSVPTPVTPVLAAEAVAAAVPPATLFNRTLRESLAEYAALSKPRIAVMVLISVGVSFTLASQGPLPLGLLLAALVGIGGSAVASSILNQWYERGSDARMLRTRNRPLPSGRIADAEALWAGVLLSLASTAWLAATVNGLTAALTLATLVLYVGVYTPLKSRTSLCTAIGAAPGAMPLVLGWTAAGGGLTWEPAVLFAILYVWQFPHFLAIAWIYQDQYREAGLRMLPADGRRPALVGLSAAAHAAVLLPVSLWARSVGLAGDPYALCAVILGCWYLLASVKFAVEPGQATARRLLWTSLAYLPMLLAALTIDHVRLLQ
ncbi:MAG: heme o synthase [Planctomyces sp.]|nr:heme o synthase [Planctomyces sp.]